MVLVTGANGQLGRCFQALAYQFPDISFHFADSKALDITNTKDVERFFEQHEIHWCINCAAYTAVDKAESEPDQARKINVTGTKNLAIACAKKGVGLIHISTDYVYHNQQNTPFIETDPVSPKGVYAMTKLKGEQAAMKAHPTTMVIRTSWVYAKHGHNFVNTMLRLGADRSELSVVFDQIGSPTYAPDLAMAIVQIIQKVDTKEVNHHDLAGIWHYSNEGVTSWYDFAKAIFEIKGMPCQVRPIESKDFPTPAKRPPFSVLNKGKIKQSFDIDIPHWRDGLSRCLGGG